MPGERVSMRKIRDVLRLRFGHQLPQRTIGQSLRLSQGAISEYLKRAQRAGLAWPLPDDLDDTALEGLLFPPPPDVPADQRPVPDWSAIGREMRRPNVTLALLWDEYRVEAADGFGYSWFCDLYRAWVGRLKPTLRQVHTADQASRRAKSSSSFASVRRRTTTLSYSRLQAHHSRHSLRRSTMPPARCQMPISPTRPHPLPDLWLL